MLVQQFPDIQWLKQKIRDNFKDKTALNNVQLKHSGWPSVVLNAKVKFVERQDIKGPFSLFLNLYGTSNLRVDGKRLKLDEQCYGLSNAGQHYDLLIDETVPTETLNIHFGEHFYKESLKAITQTNSELLDDPFSVTNNLLNLAPNSRMRTAEFDSLINQLMCGYQTHENEAQEEEILFELLRSVMVAGSKEAKRVASLPIRSTHIRDEIVRRLYLARDFIHAHYRQQFSLDELSQVSCLSKFHFLRLFKQLFQFTPYQYQKQLRFNRALSLYKSGWTLETIAPAIGMENASSVSRMFVKQSGFYPSQLV